MKTIESVRSINFNLFDKCCKIAEILSDSGTKKARVVMPDLPEPMVKLTEKLQKLNLFYFDGNALEVLPKIVHNDMYVDFFLPFSLVAVEDDMSLVIIEEICKVPASNEDIKFRYYEFKQVSDTEHILFYGEINGKPKAHDDGKTVDIGLLENFCGIICSIKNHDVKKIIMIDNSFPSIDMVLEEFSKNSYSAYQEMMYACDPTKFILETTPGKVRQPKKGRIPRSHERQIYTMLKPGSIREVMGLDKPQVENPLASGVRTPHERRGHWRTFKSEYFVRKQGERKWIEAVWIGPSEAKVGNKVYRVVLDR